MREWGGGVVRYFSIFYFFFLFFFPPLFAASTLRIMFPPPGETSAGGHECGKRRSPFGGIVLHFRYYPTGAIGLQWGSSGNCRIENSPNSIVTNGASDIVAVNGQFPIIPYTGCVGARVGWWFSPLVGLNVRVGGIIVKITNCTPTLIKGHPFAAMYIGWCVFVIFPIILFCLWFFYFSFF